jgi:hypothetical protein
MRIRFALPSSIEFAGASLILLVALTGCASTNSDGSVRDPVPLAVKVLGRSDGKYNQTDEESQSLAGVQGVWRRGQVLTVDTEEGIQYRFVDAGVCEGYYTCRRWGFRGSAQTISQTPKPHPVNYWLVEFDQGEGGYWLAIDEFDGSSTVLDTKPAVSPDKKYWATGECNEEAGDSLKILDSDDFGRLILAVEADDAAPCCEIVGWDGDALKVKSCDLEPDKVFEDNLVLQANGLWAGKRIHLGKPRSP